MPCKSPTALSPKKLVSYFLHFFIKKKITSQKKRTQKNFKIYLTLMNETPSGEIQTIKKKEEWLLDGILGIITGAMDVLREVLDLVLERGNMLP
jgi:hypothetical protein